MLSLFRAPVALMRRRLAGVLWLAGAGCQSPAPATAPPTAAAPAASRPAAAAASPLLATARNVDHVGINVPDLDQAITFFTQVIGAELLWRKPAMHDSTGHTFPQAFQTSPQASVRIAMVRCGPGLNVELLEYHAPHQRRRIPVNSDVDVSHLCFFVEDMAAAATYLSAHGCRVLAGPNTNHGPNEGELYQYFLTPWGMSMEILKRPTPLPYEQTTSARVYGPAPAWREARGAH